MFNDLVDCQKNASVDLIDSGIKDGEMKACSDQGCDTVKGVDENADKVKFDSVNDEMLTRNEGSSNLKLPIVSHINYAASADTKMPYASAANKLENLIDNKLMTVPTEIDEFGNEFVVFDEELINDGSRRWQLTLCGFFVGFKMRINELRYNVRRMWSRYGLTEDINMENDRTKPDKLPLWVRLCNPPLEALTVKGISSLASRIGKPLIMDARTASMCKLDVGRIGYARVLVEVPAKKGLPDKIDIVYQNVAKEITGQKTVKVMYDWALCVCSECGVFGHNVKMCPKNTDVVNNDQPDVISKVHGLNKSKTVYQPKQDTNNGNDKMKGNDSDMIKENDVAQDGTKNGTDKTPKKMEERINLKALLLRKRIWSANKYSVLENLDEEVELNEMEGLANREKVDAFINMKKQPTLDESADWNHDDKKVNEHTPVEIKDVYSINDGMTQEMNEGDLKGVWNIMGMSSSTKQDEEINLIAFKNLNICVTLETHLKSSMLDKDMKEEIYERRVITNGYPWAISGDFNVTLTPNEHSAGRSFVTTDMMEFKDYINQVDVEDLSSTHLHFSWIKNIEKVKLGDYFRILKKLDKVLVNEDFIKEFCKIVEEKWKADVRGLSMYNLVKKLKFLKHPLNNLNWSNGNLVEKVKALNEDLKLKMRKSCYSRNAKSNGLAMVIILAKKSYGDNNNTFFHKMLKGRNQRNRIQVIHDTNGQRYEGDQVAFQFVNHFKNFLGINVPVTPITNCEAIFTTKLSKKDASQIIRPFTDREIKEAMFSISDNKAPGPDGYSARYFKKAWHIVGTDICNVVKEFFSSGKLLGELNATIISHIPKINTPFMVTDFGQIACCNVVYKCISKVITKKIKGCLDKLINKNKSDFIPGRLILDNILLAQDLMQGYNRESSGFFNGGRGLRQDDPMSPYLFTMVMEFFTLVMEKNVRNTPDLNYRLLTFALLMIFCINEEEQQRLLTILLFAKGCLPIRLVIRTKYLRSSMGKKTVIWLDNNGNPKRFTMKNVYDDIREHSEEVKWGKLVWFSQCIPKHSFILWISVEESLGWLVPLMLTVGILADKPCLKSIWSIIRRLCLGAAIYFIWQERNFRIFRSQKRE
ncbi:RNA-directed DNA polymerase, eukaryota, reverse transcriptase zinc-binding domain protein [Tanacetum coccineum]